MLCCEGRLTYWIEHFRWDWMIFPGTNLTEQLLLDLILPPLAALFMKYPKYYCMTTLNDPSEPQWYRNLPIYVMLFLYVWFFSATYYHFFIAVHK